MSGSQRKVNCSLLLGREVLQWWFYLYGLSDWYQRLSCCSGISASNNLSGFDRTISPRRLVRATKKSFELIPQPCSGLMNTAFPGHVAKGLPFSFDLSKQVGLSSQGASRPHLERPITSTIDFGDFLFSPTLTGTFSYFQSRNSHFKNSNRKLRKIFFSLPFRLPFHVRNRKLRFPDSERDTTLNFPNSLFAASQLIIFAFVLVKQSLEKGVIRPHLSSKASIIGVFLSSFCFLIPFLF